MSRRCRTRITRRGERVLIGLAIAISAAIGFALPNPLNACTADDPCPHVSLERTP